MTNRRKATNKGARASALRVAEAERPRRPVRLTKDNYRAIFENSAVAITVTDANERIVSWNGFAEVLLGMDGNDLHMRPVESLYPEHEWQRIRSQNVRRKGMQHHIETRVIRKDQEVIDVDLSVTVLKAPEGQITGSIGIMADVTERKKAEEALRRSEELARGMIETAATGMYLMEDGRFTYVNRLMEEISGRTSDELVGTQSITYVHPADRETVRARAIECLEGRSVLPYEFRAIRKDLEIIWVSERVVSVEFGGKLAVVGTLTDITERERAEAASRADARRTETLLNIGSAVGRTLNVADLLDSVLESVFEVMPIGAGGVFLADRETGDLVLAAHRGFSEGFSAQIARMKIGRGFAGRTALSGKPVIVGSATTDIRFDPVVLEQEGLRALCSVPILARDEILGVISVGSGDSRDFAEDDVRLLTSIANQVGIAIENAQLYEKTVEIAFTDDLTGLYNRRYFMEQLERELARAVRSGSPLSLVMIDMDGLKGINDRFGHDRGSEFLKDLGLMIKLNTRTSDVPARLGGDEFAILAPDTDSEAAGEIGERLRADSASRKRAIEGWDVGMSVSVGIASCPSHASDIDELIKKADDALYEAKRAGKNQVRVAAEPSAAALAAS